MMMRGGDGATEYGGKIYGSHIQQMDHLKAMGGSEAKAGDLQELGFSLGMQKGGYQNKKGKGKKRSARGTSPEQTGGSTLVDVAVPIALIAANQSMGRRRHSTKHRKTYRKRK